LGSVSDDRNAQDEPLATSFLVPDHLSFRVGLDHILAACNFERRPSSSVGCIQPRQIRSLQNKGNSVARKQGFYFQ